MHLRHVGLTCRCEENADRFYRDLLGLEKVEPKLLPAPLSLAIFDVEADLPMINYTGPHAHFEIFIADIGDAGRIGHACIEVADMAAFLRGCDELGVVVRRIPKGDITLTFVRDLDGNLFEVKETPPGNGP